MFTDMALKVPLPGHVPEGYRRYGPTAQRVCWEVAPDRSQTDFSRTSAGISQFESEMRATVVVKQTLREVQAAKCGVSHNHGRVRLRIDWRRGYHGRELPQLILPC